MIPVVVSENGLGVPVRPVDSGAPAMTVAANGLGMPVFISDRGAPFVVNGQAMIWPRRRRRIAWRGG
ncbi:MAG: hypothetical protein KF874_00495 [Rhizobiaceae bacterium]|nr:hypothetical protein [Rhizobiaceae bacterium]